MGRAPPGCTLWGSWEIVSMARKIPAQDARDRGEDSGGPSRGTERGFCRCEVGWHAGLG